MPPSIHPTAHIEKGATLGKNVNIGPYCTVGSNVSIGDNTILKSHIAIEGHTTIGTGNLFFPFTSIGSQPQDLKYGGEPSRLIIGNNNTIREHVTINTGTKGGGMETRVGNDCLLMTASHVAHDCILGNHVILANNATLGGHVEIDDFAIIGGLSAIHQFVRIGHHAIIGGMSGIENDVIPYGQAMGERAGLSGINLIGLKRRNFSRQEIHAIRNAYKMLFTENDKTTLEERINTAEAEFSSHESVMEILNFMKKDSHRSLCLPK